MIQEVVSSYTVQDRLEHIHSGVWFIQVNQKDACKVVAHIPVVGLNQKVLIWPKGNCRKLLRAIPAEHE